MFRITAFAALLLASTVSAQVDDPDAEFAKANSIGACRKVYAAASKSMPTAAIRGISSSFSKCTKRVMNGEVDKVLRPLQKASIAKFKAGMTMQKSFNDAVQKYCGRWSKYYEKCCSTCSFNEQPECEADFHTARVALVKAELANASLPANAKTNENVSREFAAFATAWCAFTDMKLECNERVLSFISSSQRDDGNALSCR